MHLPQCRELVRRSVSQPFEALPSQLPKSASQVKPHAELVHVAVACAGAVHWLPQRPQLETSLAASEHDDPQASCGAVHEFAAIVNWTLQALKRGMSDPAQIVKPEPVPHEVGITTPMDEGAGPTVVEITGLSSMPLRTPTRRR